MFTRNSLIVKHSGSRQSLLQPQPLARLLLLLPLHLENLSTPIGKAMKNLVFVGLSGLSPREIDAQLPNPYLWNSSVDFQRGFGLGPALRQRGLQLLSLFGTLLQRLKTTRNSLKVDRTPPISTLNPKP